MAATAFSPQLSRASSASPSYRWEVPGKPVIVHVALEVVDRLDWEVAESFRSLEARGSEIGGLLLGVVQGFSPFEVSIQSYEVVPSEYKRGPLYQLSLRDLERFKSVLEERVGAGIEIVGFFRSHTRKGLGLDTEDLAIFNGFFPKQYQVALLAKPFATKLTAGAIFIREGGSLRSESSYKVFHFGASTVERRCASVASLKGGEKAFPASAQAATVLTVPPGLPRAASPVRSAKLVAAVRATVSAKPVPALRTVRPICIAASGKLAAVVRFARPTWTDASAKLAAAFRAAPLMWIAGASVAALVVLSGLLLFPVPHLTKRAATTSSRDTSTLSFRVERSAGELLLSWNRDADVIHEATHAVLAIADGERHQSVDLDQPQLRDGGIVYLPSNSEINFQLTVTGRKASQTQSESVRVLRVSPWVVPEPPLASPPKPVPNRTRAANPLTLRSPGAFKGPGAEFAKVPDEAALRADDLAQSSGAATALDLPDAPMLTAGPQAQAVFIPGRMIAPAGTQLSLFQVLGTAPPDGPVPVVGGQASEAQILTQRSEHPLADKRARVQGSVVVRALSALTAPLSQRRRCRVVQGCRAPRSQP